MATGWETSVVECRGGLVTNVAPLQQGINTVGTARQLVNFEPSIKGGYRRILGYKKYDTAQINPFGSPVVQGSGQTGTTLVIADLMDSPLVNDVLSISGVSGTYTIDGISYSVTAKSATITLDTTLASSPADKAAVSISQASTELITGVKNFNAGVVATRGGNVYHSTGSGWTKISVPANGPALVDGGSQTGTSINIDSLTAVTVFAGQTFSVAGVEKVYTVTSDVTVSAGGAALSITPALASSPADNAAITWLSQPVTDNGKTRMISHDFSGTTTLVGVNGTGKAWKWNGSSFQIIEGTADVEGSEFVAEFKNHIFFGKGSLLSFSEPYKDDDFDTGDGAGSINLPYNITGLIIFRDKLIVFSTDSIHYITGSSASDFALTPISNNLGCIAPDTIQEVGGDVAFLGPDGVRLLSGTQNIGDFGLAVASRAIQSDMKQLMEDSTSFSSVVVRVKSQYRVFGYKSATSSSASRGVVGVQFADQTAEGMAWATLRGFKAYVADSEYRTDLGYEVVVFANSNGYVYQMEQENDFDGANIQATYYTPYLSITDPQFRKTIHKVYSYIDPEGIIDGQLQLRFDFDDPDKIQPPSLTFGDATTTTVPYYGIAVYGTNTFGSTPKKVFTNQAVGAGFTVSLEYEFDDTYPPFSIDAIVFEYMTNDRQ